MPEYDFGYHPEGRSKFKDKFGIDPLDIDGGEFVQKWKQFRLDAVSSLVKELKAISHEKKTKISAAVFRTKNVKQNGTTRLVKLGSKYNMSNELSFIYDGDINWIGESISKGIKYKNIIIYTYQVCLLTGLIQMIKKGNKRIFKQRR